MAKLHVKSSTGRGQCGLSAPWYMLRPSISDLLRLYKRERICKRCLRVWGR